MLSDTYWTDRQKLQKPHAQLSIALHSTHTAPLQNHRPNGLSFSNSLKLSCVVLWCSSVRSRAQLRGKPGFSITAGPCGFQSERLALSGQALALLQRSETEPGREHHLFKVNWEDALRWIAPLTALNQVLFIPESRGLSEFCTALENLHLVVG